MNADLMLKHFERISEAPDAVARLRRFILDLAVRGKLVEQNPNDEPAAELLKRIQAEKARCEKKAKALTSVTEDEAPFDVPVGWKWVRIRQITTDRGQAVPKGDFTYIDVTAIDKERGCIGEPTILSASEAPSRARKIIQKGDVIYSCVRPYLLNIAVIDTDINPLPVASTAFAVMNGFGLTLPQYLWIALRSPFMVESVEARMRGQAYPAINDSDFALLPLPLPPLAEQHRIVAKVDALMALCDQLQAAQNEREARRDRLVAASLHRIGTAPATASEAETGSEITTPLPEAARFHLAHLPRLTTRPEHIKQLRQTILNLAVLGRIVPQDPNDESVASPLTESDADGEWPFHLPDSWGWRHIGELSELVTDGEHATPTRIDEHQVPLVTAKNVRNGKMDYTITDWVSFDTAAKAWRRCRPILNDILLVCVGATTGRLCILREPRDMVLVRSVALIRPSHMANVDYLALAMRSPIGQSQIWSSVKVTAQPCLYINRINSLAIPLPPLAEQHRIVAKVDELMALCDQLEAQLTTTQTDSRRLLEAVLHEALAA